MLFVLWILVFLLGCAAQSLIQHDFILWGLLLYLLSGSLCFLLFCFSKQPDEAMPSDAHEPPQKMWLGVPSAFGIVLLCGAAQWYIQQGGALKGSLLYLVAAVLAVLLAWYIKRPGQHVLYRPSEPQPKEFYWIPFVFGVFLLFIATFLVYNGTSRSGVVGTYLNYAIYFWLGFVILTVVSAGRPLVEYVSRQDRKFYIPLGLLMLTALAFGLYHLTQIPPTVHGDEGMVGLNARKILEGKITTFFSSSWYEIPQLFFFIPSVGMFLFGDSLFGLRMSAVLVGVLTIVPFFILARAWWGTSSAVITSLLLILNHWFLHLMHSGVSYIQAAFFATALLCFWYFANRKRSLSLLLFAGLTLGLALMSYQANHLLPALWIASQGWLFFLRKISLRWFVASVLIPLEMALLLLSPLIAHETILSGRLNMFSTRASSVVAWAPFNLQHLNGVHQANGNTGKIVQGQVRKAFLSTILYPDTSLQYGGGKPFLDRYAAVLLLFSMVVACYRFFDVRWSIPFWWIVGVLLAGGAMTVDPPFFPRLTAITTILYLALGGVISSVLSIRPRQKYFKYAALLALCGIAALAAADNVKHYFRTYAEKINPRNVHYAQTQMGRYMLERGAGETYYVFSGGHFSSQSGTVLLLVKDIRYQDVPSVEAVDAGRPFALIVAPDRNDMVAAIQAKWPQLKEKVHYSPLGDKLFTTYTNG